MSAILPFVRIDSSSLLARYFTSYQIAWIEAEDPFHDAKQQVFALAEKSVRIGWTFCDGFKNVRKRLRFKNRDYLFATKDLPSALEYMNEIYNFADMLGYTRAVLSHGEDFIKVKTLDPEGNPTPITEELKIGYIKFQNGSRIIAFSSNPYAMAVYGGDVGLDEFAKHPNASLLWQTAQGRVTWGCDLAVWSAHDGEDTLFNQFAQQARTTCAGRDMGRAGSPQHAGSPSSQTPGRDISPKGPSHSRSPGRAGSPQHAGSPPPSAPIETRHSQIENCPASLCAPRLSEKSVPSPTPISTHPPKPENRPGPWNLYFRVTMEDAVELGIVDVINRTKGTALTPEQFLSDCRARSGSEETYQQAYMCNPLGAATASIVEWSAIERCRYDYSIERLHLESNQVLQRFGQFDPASQPAREKDIRTFLHDSFPNLFDADLPPANRKSKFKNLRLGFDVAASGQGDLAAFYIDEYQNPALCLRALLTVRTEDWHFLSTALACFLDDLRGIRAAGDESGLGRQICWEAASKHGSRFLKVNFAAKKQDLGFSLMNQLSVAEKRFPRSEQAIAADFFAIRKAYTGTRWVFTEGRNTFNPASHCDIAWAAALSSHAHTEKRCEVGAGVVLENGWFDGKDYHPNIKGGSHHTMTPEQALLSSEDPNIWTRIA